MIARQVDDKQWNLPKIYCHLVIEAMQNETNCFKGGRQTNSNLKCVAESKQELVQEQLYGAIATSTANLLGEGGGWGSGGGRG